MKEKSMWKELLNRAGWLLIFLLATILYQIPIGVTAILTLNAVPLLQSGLIVAGISIVVLALFIFGARKTQLASFNFSFFRAKDLARLGLSYLVIICSNILGSILLQLSNETTTSNQSQILTNVPPLFDQALKKSLGTYGPHEQAFPASPHG